MSTGPAAATFLSNSNYFSYFFLPTKMEEETGMGKIKIAK